MPVPLDGSLYAPTRKFNTSPFWPTPSLPRSLHGPRARRIGHAGKRTRPMCTLWFHPPCISCPSRPPYAAILLGDLESW